MKGKGEGSNQNAKISLCGENLVREQNIAFEYRSNQGVQSKKTTMITVSRFPEGLERGNPAMTAKRWRKGVKQIHNINVVEKTHDRLSFQAFNDLMFKA